MTHTPLDSFIASHLPTLTKAELLSLQKAVQIQLETNDRESRAKALEAARIVAQSKGYTLEELLEKPSKPHKNTADRASSTATYVDPTNPDNIWKGRGRPPSWFQQALKNGYSKDSMRKTE